MEKQLHDILDEIIKSIRHFAKESYEAGHPMSQDDINEFRQLLKEDDNWSKLESSLFYLYFEHYDDYRSEQA